MDTKKFSRVSQISVSFLITRLSQHILALEFRPYLETGVVVLLTVYRRAHQRLGGDLFVCESANNSAISEPIIKPPRVRRGQD